MGIASEMAILIFVREKSPVRMLHRRPTPRIRTRTKVLSIPGATGPHLPEKRKADSQILSDKRRMVSGCRHCARRDDKGGLWHHRLQCTAASRRLNTKGRTAPHNRPEDSRAFSSTLIYQFKYARTCRKDQQKKPHKEASLSRVVGLFVDGAHYALHECVERFFLRRSLLDHFLDFDRTVEV